MDDFLIRFFPAVYAKKHQVKENNYCKYNNQYLQLFTSSLYLAAIVASFFASKACKKFGRKPTIQAASIFFVAGAILNTAAKDIGMLIAGRLCLGAGVGFGNQVTLISQTYIGGSSWEKKKKEPKCALSDALSPEILILSF